MIASTLTFSPLLIFSLISPNFSKSISFDSLELGCDVIDSRYLRTTRLRFRSIRSLFGFFKRAHDRIKELRPEAMAVDTELPGIRSFDSRNGMNESHVLFCVFEKVVAGHRLTG